jgi:hypothetical protein
MNNALQIIELANARNRETQRRADLRSRLPVAERVPFLDALDRAALAAASRVPIGRLRRRIGHSLMAAGKRVAYGRS